MRTQVAAEVISMTWIQELNLDNLEIKQKEQNGNSYTYLTMQLVTDTGVWAWGWAMVTRSAWSGVGVPRGAD